MSGALKTIGKIAGIAAIIPGPQQAVFAAIAVVASIGAQITARPPVAQGSATDVTIGADMPSAHVLGRCYHGGDRVAQTGYGEEGDVPNAHAWFVDIGSRGNKRSGLEGVYADFNLIEFDTDTPFTDGNAIGFYHNRMHRVYQLGETPESGALMPHWSDAPDWGTDYRLSGCAALGINIARDEENEQFSAGIPQFGAIWLEPYGYDPRLDDEWPGGAGPHRWADPADKVAFAAAKATWEGDTPTRCPGIQGLNYALGHWQRDETDTDAEYTLVMGAGGDFDSIRVEDFVALANVCDANGWNCDGVINEPGEGAFWENLKNIVAAGGAEPVISGGRLGLRIRTARVAIDTITRDDFVSDEIVAAAVLPWEDRINAIQTKFRSEAHRWEFVPGALITSSDLVTMDGRKKIATRQFNCVAGTADAADQAAQLGGLDLVDAREQVLENIRLNHRLRGVKVGEVLTLSPERRALFGVTIADWEVRRDRFDPVTMTLTLTLVSETPGKYAFALAQTGVSPPDITIWTPEEIDGAANGSDGLLTDEDGELMLTEDGDYMMEDG